MPFVRLLLTNETEEVAQALASIMRQIMSLSQGVPEVFRIHVGQKFVGKAFIAEVQRLSIWPTTSAPHSPQQNNGKAERLVGLIKSAVALLLLHGKLLRLWMFSAASEINTVATAS